MTEDDIKEWLVENTDSEMTAEELQAQYEYINSQTQTLSNGLYEMTDMCKINMKSTYPSMDMNGTESCEIDFQLRSLLHVSNDLVHQGHGRHERSFHGWIHDVQGTRTLHDPIHGSSRDGRRTSPNGRNHEPYPSYR